MPSNNPVTLQQLKRLKVVGLDQAKTFLNGLGIDYPTMVYANAISSNTTESNKKYGASSEKMVTPLRQFLPMVVSTTNQCISIKLSLVMVVQKSFRSGRALVKETTAYMMTEMMKTVLYLWYRSRRLYILVLQAGKTVHLTTRMRRLKTHQKHWLCSSR